LAAVELAAHADFADEQLKAMVALHSSAIENAMVKRAAANPAWGAKLVNRLRTVDKFEDAPLIARVASASFTEDVLEEMTKAEQVEIFPWEALMDGDPRGRIGEARAVLDGTSEFVAARTEPLRGEYGILAAHISNSARRAACNALMRGSDGDAADIARVATELRRGSFESNGPALDALIALTATEKVVTAGSAEAPTDTDELARVVGDLSVLDGYWSPSRIDALLSSRLAPLVVPVWRASEISSLRVVARRWELKQPTTSDADLEEALYFEDSAVRMGALDELIIRWDEDQLAALLNRYGSQERQYWYNVIAALDEHLYGYRPRKLEQKSRQPI
jgi:hypothetical protein